MMLSHGPQRGPSGPGGNGRGRLMAALGVGNEHEVGVLLDDVLGRDLRVAGTLLVGRISDVAQARELIDRADERLRRHRVVRVVELVVVGEHPAFGHFGRKARDLTLHLAHERGRRRGVAGRGAELRDLRIGVSHRRGGRFDEHRDVQLGELRREPPVGAVDDDEIGAIARNRLDVGLVARELRAWAPKPGSSTGRRPPSPVRRHRWRTSPRSRSATATRCAWDERRCARFRSWS